MKLYVWEECFFSLIVLTLWTNITINLTENCPEKLEQWLYLLAVFSWVRLAPKPPEYTPSSPQPPFSQSK